MNQLSRTEDGGLEFVQIGDVSWVRSWRGLSDPDMRCFPEMPGSDAKRAQAVAYLADGSLLVGRNNEERQLFRLVRDDDGWHVNSIMRLTGTAQGYVEGIGFEVRRNEVVAVLNARTTTDDAPRVVTYNLTTGQEQDRVPALGIDSHWIYGPLVPGGDNEKFVVTDRRCTKAPHGIYCVGDTEPIVPGVTGNGLCLVEVGGERFVLVTQYNSYDWPGQIVVIKADRLGL